MSSQAELPQSESINHYWGKIEKTSFYPYPNINIPMANEQVMGERLTAHLEAWDCLEMAGAVHPIKTYDQGEPFSFKGLKDGNIVKFRREYGIETAHEEWPASQRMLEALTVTQAVLVAMKTEYSSEHIGDALAGLHRVNRHEIQEGLGVALEVGTEGRLAIFGVKKVARPRVITEADRVRNKKRPLGWPKPRRVVDENYEFVHLRLPLHNPAPIGVSTEVINLPDPVTGEINPYSRRIERLNSVEIFPPR